MPDDADGPVGLLLPEHGDNQIEILGVGLDGALEKLAGVVGVAVEVEAKAGEAGPLECARSQMVLGSSSNP